MCDETLFLAVFYRQLFVLKRELIRYWAFM